MGRNSGAEPGSDSMPRLLTLGRFELASETASPEPISIQPKRLALLAYLAAASPSGAVMHRRDTLLGLFWPELPQDDARRALRHALHHLRKAVGPEAILTRTDDQVGIDPALIESDRADFERVLGEKNFTAALELYKGDFLRGVFVPEASPQLEDWIERTRLRLRNGAVDAARHAIADAKAEGRDADALSAAFRANEIAPDDEAVLRLLLPLLHSSGDKAAVTRIYENLARRLKEEIGIEPEPETTALYNELRRAPSKSVLPAPLCAARRIDEIDQSADLPKPGDRFEPERGTHVALRPRFRKMPFLVVAGILVLATIAWSTRARFTRATHEVTSIAVLPFEIANKDTAAAFFADGMTEELGAALSRAGIRVAARSSVAALHARPDGDAEIRRLLGVRLVLHSRVERSGQRFRVWTQLVNGDDGIALWTRTYDTTMTDVFRVQEDLAQAIVREMRPSLGSSIVRESSRSARGTGDVAAYDLFMRGRYYTDHLQSERAIDAFKKSIDHDPAFAGAWSALSRAYANLALTGIKSSDSLVVLASQAAGRAVQLDPNLAGAYAATGVVLLNEWKFPAAEAAFKRAIELEPDNPDNYLEYSNELFIEGRMDESLREVQRMRELDPVSIGAIVVKQYVLTMLGRWEEERAETRAGLELDSTFVPLYQNAGVAEAFAGKPDSALALLSKGYKLDPRMFGNAAYAQFGFAVAGRWKDVDRIRADSRSDTGNSPYFFRAVNAAIDGDVAVAVDAMQKGFDKHEALFLFISAACDPMFDILRSDARYEQILSQYSMHACASVGKWPVSPRPRS